MLARSCRLLSLLLPFVILASAGAESPTLWPERERAFLQDGAGFLLSQEQRSELLAAEPAERTRLIDEFLARDPLPETPNNELTEAIELRRSMLFSEFDTPADARGRLLFLLGSPRERLIIDCGQAFKPMEIWNYSDDREHSLVLFEASLGEPWRLWRPGLDGKVELYESEMAYYLQQWEESQGKLFYAERFDYQMCRPEARAVDRATGIRVLTEQFRLPTPLAELQRYFEPPDSLAQWARAALGETAIPGPEPLVLSDSRVSFPTWKGQRITTRILLTLPPDAGFEVDHELEEPALRLVVDAVVERDAVPMDRVSIRYVVPAPDPGGPGLPLVLERAFRPGDELLVRLRLRDEVSGRELRWLRGLQVPDKPVPEPLSPEIVAGLEMALAERTFEGADNLQLIPPDNQVLAGLWEAEVLVAGSRITKVIFLVDDQVVFTRNRAPWRAELRLAPLPREQLIRVQGLDEEGELVAEDELVINQRRGRLRVRIVEPARGVPAEGPTLVRVEVIVPEERTVEQVDFSLDDKPVTTDRTAPWEAEVVLPPRSEQLRFLTATAVLDDGSRAEDVRFLSSMAFAEQVEVQLVELYTTVSDRSGRPVADLSPEDFEVFEEGSRQKLREVRRVQDLPLTVGVAMDTSTSMEDQMDEARQAAIEFLENVVRQGDRAFAVTFSDHANLLVPPTEDVTAVTTLLARQEAHGWTALHDALVTSLFHFRGSRNQRVLVLVSDGDDSASAMSFEQALEYARLSGVAIYAVGLDVGALELGIRHKLEKLAESTGGRAFLVSDAEQLRGVYREIEEELRSRYLLTYSPDRTLAEGELRRVEVKVRRRGLRTRTVRSVSP